MRLDLDGLGSESYDSCSEMVGTLVLPVNHELNVRQVLSISRELRSHSLVDSSHTLVPSQSAGPRQFGQYIDILREPS